VNKETANAKVLRQMGSQTPRTVLAKHAEERRLAPNAVGTEAASLRLSSAGLLLALSFFFSAGAHAQQMTTIDGQTSPTLQSGSNPNQLFNPSGVGVDACGNVFVADTANQRVIALGLYGTGTPTVLIVNPDGQPVNAVAGGSNGIVYFADSNGEVYTVNSASPQQGAKNIAGFAGSVQALAVDGLGNWYALVSNGDPRLALITKNGSPFTGPTIGNVSGLGGGITGLAADAAGNVYTYVVNPNLSTSYDYPVKIAPGSSTAEPLAGPGAISLGAGSSVGLAVDRANNLYLTTNGGSNVVQLNITSGATTIYAGTGAFGYNGDGYATSSEINAAQGLATDSLGNLYIADSGNNLVRRVTTPTPTGGSPTACGIQTMSLTDVLPNVGNAQATYGSQSGGVTQSKLYLGVFRATGFVGGVSDVVVYKVTSLAAPPTHDNVVANIPIPAIPVSITADNVNGWVYVLDTSNTVTVIDAQTDTINSSVTLPLPAGAAQGEAAVIVVDETTGLVFATNLAVSGVYAIQGPVRASAGTSGSPASYKATITGILPLGPIGVDESRGLVYAIVAGVASLGSETYTLAMIDETSLTVTGQFNYLTNASATSVSTSALGVDALSSGYVITADAADSNFHIFNESAQPLSINQEYSTGTTNPNYVAIDTSFQLAYVHDGYGTVNLLNLALGEYFPAIITPASGGNCGPTSVAVGTNGFGQAYITTCDATSGAVLHLYDGLGVGEFTSQNITLDTPAQLNNNGIVGASLMVSVDPLTRAAFVKNATNASSGFPPNYGTVVVNGSAPTARPRLTLSTTSLTFGSSTAVLAAGTIQSQTITVTNNGIDSYAPLAPISQFQSTLVPAGNPSFAITSDGCTNSNLATGASCNVTVQYTSNAYGQTNAALVFLDDSPDTPQVVTLTGYGRAPLVALQVLPAGTATNVAAVLPTATTGFIYSQVFSVPNAQGPLTLELCPTNSAGGPILSSCCVSNGSISPCSGLLPPGLSWDGFSKIIGTPAVGSAGTYTFNVFATDANGDTGSQDYSLTVAPGPSLTSFTLNPSAVESGHSTTGILTLNSAPPAPGLYVSLTKSGPNITIPTTVLFAPGQTSATFEITVPSSTSSGVVSILATYNATIIGQLIIGSASATVAVPYVVGEAQATAQTVLTNMGLGTGPVNMQYSDTVPLGSVISEAPIAGTLVAFGTAVGLTVSEGPTPESITENVSVQDTVFFTAVTSYNAAIASYSFSSLGFSSSGTQILTLSNIGAKNLNVTNVAINGSAYSITSVDCSNASATVLTTLLPGAACAVTIAYNASNGSPAGTIQFMDNASLSNVSNAGSNGNYAQTIPLSGSTSTSVQGGATLLTLSVSPNNQLLNPGATLQFDAMGTFSDGTARDVTSLANWSSSLPGVATISNSARTVGLATGVSGGTTLIGAQLNLVTATASATLNVPIVIQEPIGVTDAPMFPNTGVGVNVLVRPVDTTTGTTPVTLTFSNVTQLGVTSLTTSPTGPPAPSGFQLGTPGVYYNLSTTATYTGSVMVCINYTGITFTQAPQIFHYQGGVWTNITSSLNTTIKIVCGSTTSFSPFALFQPSAISTTTSISAPSVSYGASGSVTVSVSSTSGAVTGSVSLSVDGGAPSTMSLTNGSAIFNVGVLNATTHALSANFAAQGNFLASSAAGAITVAQAPLTIAANNVARVYGGANPTLTASYAGFVNGDSASVLIGALSCSTTATPASSVGTYPITCSGQSATNYSITYAPGQLTVTPALLTITANNLTKNFDAPNPTLTWTASGFVNGNTTSVLTTLPTCTTTATTTSPVGSYPITCSGAAAANYTFSYASGALTVSCHYVSIGLSPSTVADGGLITVSWTLRSCASTTQTVAFSFTLSGPAQPDSCSPTKTEMFSLPPFALKPNTLDSLSFPFKVPKGICAGTYSTTATTTIGGQVVDTSSTSLTITAP
jgi:mucin-19